MPWPSERLHGKPEGGRVRAGAGTCALLPTNMRGRADCGGGGGGGRVLAAHAMHGGARHADRTGRGGVYVRGSRGRRGG